MFCSNCGSEMTKDSRFCGECGTPVGGSNQEEAISSGGSVSSIQSVAQNDYVVKGKELSKSYFQVLKRQLKAPFFEAQSMKEDKMTNGLISIMLFSLFLALSSFLTLQQASSGFVDVPFFSTVVGMFAGWVILFFLVTLVLFVTFKIMRTEAGYGNLMNRMGSLMAMPLLFSASAFLTGLVQLGFLSTLFMSLATASAALSVFSVIFSVQRNNDKAMDPFYGTIIATVGTTIVIFIVFVAVLGSLFNQLQHIMF